MSTEERLWEWVRAHLAQRLGVAPETIALDKGLSDYGLDSVDAVLMAGELEEAFAIEIDPASFIECDSFRAVIVLLATYIDKSEGRAASS
jgi:acyl carrier protein